MSNKVQSSITVAINSLAQSKKAQGIRVYNLSAGEPKLMTPEVVRAAAIKFIEIGDVPYPITAGHPELRKLACEWINRLYGANYSVNESLITTGGKYGIYLLLQYLLGANSPLKTNPQEELAVMVPAPYWVSYPAITKIMTGKAIVVNTTEDGEWKITPQMIRAAYQSNCKLLFLNNGVNPTGIIYTREEIAAILAVAEELGIWIISDEVYSGLVYNGDEYVSCASFPEYKDNVIVIQSASKSFAMTGWRVGFLFAKSELIEALTSLTSQSTTGVSLVCQHGAIAAFKHADEIMGWVNASMKHRRDVFIAAVKEYFGIELPQPKATLYSFVSLAKLGVLAGISDEELCFRALEEANVATVPGSGFGQPGYLRFSFAADEEDLTGGVAALANFIKTLAK